MLVVTRKVSESVTLVEKDGTIIKVYVSSVKGNIVKLAVQAPLTVEVLRTDDKKSSEDS